MNENPTHKLIQDMLEQMKPDEKTLQNLQDHITSSPPSCSPTAPSSEPSSEPSPPALILTKDGPATSADGSTKSAKTRRLWFRLGIPTAACLLVAVALLFSGTNLLKNNNPGSTFGPTFALTHPASYDELYDTLESFYASQNSQDDYVGGDERILFDNAWTELETSPSQRRTTPPRTDTTADQPMLPPEPSDFITDSSDSANLTSETNGPEPVAPGFAGSPPDLAAPSNGSTDSDSVQAGNQSEPANSQVESPPPAELTLQSSEEGSASTDDVTAKTSPDYSGTNVQVTGIDEGDIVKTDGKNIYILSNQNLIILSAKGAESKELSRIKLSDNPGDGYAFVEDTDNALAKDITQAKELAFNTTVISPAEIFIWGDILVVLCNNSGVNRTLPAPNQDILETGSPNSDTPRAIMPNLLITTATLYDISDPTQPTQITQISQSGFYQSARLQNGLLYLISEYSVYGDTIDRDIPETFVPIFVVDQVANLIPPEDIHIFPSPQSSAYSVISSINLAEHKIISQKTVLGGGNVLYMSPNNLYLAATRTVTEQSEEYQDSVYTVTDYTITTKTHLAKLSLNQGVLSLAADAVFNGNLLNQFSLDEFEGNLRIALTTSMSKSRQLRDESHGVVSYQYLESPPQSNAIYVLSPNLTVLGSIEGLAQDERIYSVRFSGKAGYMVTFRQVDPLFSLDLSDPSNPKVLGALKIPGFSTYLHPYSPGLLFGLGFDSDGIRSSRLKLSMFDISDPYNVKELSTLLLDGYYAEAAYNHKAIIVDSAHNLIGFELPQSNTGSSTYGIYGYSPEKGFYQRANLKYGGHAPYRSNARGFYVDEGFYIGSPHSLDVFTLADFQRLTALNF